MKNTKSDIISGRNIQFPQVRLVTSEGAEIVDRDYAIRLAAEQNKDLIQISITNNIPVCKIIEINKYVYELKKKEKKKNKKQPTMKELQVSINIADSDLMTKIRHAERFIKEGNKVKFFIRLRRKEIADPNILSKSKLLLSENISEVLKHLNVNAKIEKDTAQDNRIVSVIYSPGK